MTGDPIELHASAFSSTTVREAAYARIRDEIAASEEVTRSWKRRYNELSLISRLPPEILATIFEFVKDVSDWEYQWSRWIRVTHTCSNWRRIALESPALWTDIPFICPRWAEEMLKRSKMAPLTVKVSLGDRLGIRNEAAVRSSLRHLSRVKYLSLAQGQFEGYDGPEEFKSLIRLLDAPAPLLETLDVTFRYGRNDESSLPANLFSGNAPRLVNLRISRCGLNWRSPIFANLRSLKVIDPPVALRPPADQFLSALSSIPRLEILEFRSDFASTGGAVVPHVSTAVLPLLTNLTIASPLLNAVLLLNHITYPTTACVAITCAIDGFRQDSDRNLSVVHGLASLLGGRVDGPIRSLAVHEQGIRAWTSPGIEPSVFSADKPQLSLDFSPLHTSSDHINDITQNVLRPLPLRHVESLLIQCVPLPETAWLDHFGGLARLKTLHVGSDPFGFLNAFSTGTSAALEQSRQAGSPKFKALRTLGISDWTFDEFHGPHVPGGRRTSCFESLVSCLKARRKEGVALSELVVEDCHHVDEADISDLEKIVAKVDWDGEANYTEEEEPEYESDEYYDDGFAPFFNTYWY